MNISKTHSLIYTRPDKSKPRFMDRIQIPKTQKATFFWPDLSLQTLFQASSLQKYIQKSQEQKGDQSVILAWG